MTKIFMALLLSIIGPLGHAADNASNAAIAKQWYEAFNKKDASIIDKIIGSEWMDIPSPPGTPPGPDGLKTVFVQLTTAFPNLHLTIEDVLQDGDKVVVRSTITGTQQEAFFGMPAKGRHLSIQAVDIHEIRNGKIVRTWHTEDWMTGLRQLGVTAP